MSNSLQNVPGILVCGEFDKLPGYICPPVKLKICLSFLFFSLNVGSYVIYFISSFIS